MEQDRGRCADLGHTRISGNIQNGPPITRQHHLAITDGRTRMINHVAVPSATPHEQRTNMTKFIDTLDRAYPTFRILRTKDCIQVIEGFEHYRSSVKDPEEIIFGTFECWEPLLDAIAEETNRFQRDSKTQ